MAAAAACQPLLPPSRLRFAGIRRTMGTTRGGSLARLFLSYDREDADKAQAIAGALEKAGHEVWWDRHIRGGSEYSKEIEQALKASLI